MRKLLWLLIALLALSLTTLAGCGKTSAKTAKSSNTAKSSTTKADASGGASGGNSNLITNVTIKPKSSTGRSIFVLVGAGLKKPMDELGKIFADKTGIQVEYTFAGSACLLAQIDNSREGDCYMPGEMYYMEQAKEKGYLKKLEVIAYVIPVIAVAKGNPKHVKDLKDLARKDVRVGIGEPHATALGRQAITVLENAGLIEQVDKNVTLKASTVPELCNGITWGHLDAALVWDAVALWYPKTVDIVRIEDKYNAVSTVPLATLTFAKDPAAADEFQKYVASKEGKAIFVKHGYSLTPKSRFFSGGKDGNGS
jgi:molybdate transport system substrate-binding protein